MLIANILIRQLLEIFIKIFFYWFIIMAWGQKVLESKPSNESNENNQQKSF